MAQFTAELLAQSNKSYSVPLKITLPVVNHVHKRIERFTYQRFVSSAATPISYLENKALDSRSNIQIVDKSWTIPTNSQKRIALRAPMVVVTSNAYSSCYREISATDRTFVDEAGKVRPLFFRHELPSDTTQCELQIVTHGNKVVLDTGYVLDLDSNSIFTNYENYYDLDTGAYRLFYVISTDSLGGTTRELLNPVPTARLASYEDLDLTTGKLTTDYPLYSREKSGSGYTFYFNKSATWFIRPLERSLISARIPAGRDATDPWFIRFTDGDLSANVNSAVRRYYIPEFDKQPFIPSNPTKFSPYGRMLVINPSVIAATRDSLNIDPENGLHLSILIRDVEGSLVRALTTDTSLIDSRYSDTDVFYETDKIVSWDNKRGLVSLGLELHRSWSISAKYYYDADDYEYSLLDLNPLTNKDVFKHTYVFYMLPDIDTEDRGIHYLKIDANGIICETSQSLGLNHPNLQLLNADNSFNVDTIIGLKYVSDTEIDTFTTLYSAGFENSFGYGILAEVSVLDISLLEDQRVVDVRRPGGVLDKDSLVESFEANPAVLQSYLGFGEDGQEVPQTNVMIIKAPLTLLEDYGGVLNQESAESMIKTHHPSANAAIIEWEYPASDIDGWSEVANTIGVSWTWEGPNVDYRLYRRGNPTGSWELVDIQSNPAEGELSYLDSDVSGSEVWYYQVRIYNGSVEFPAGNSVGIKVR